VRDRKKSSSLAMSVAHRVGSYGDASPATGRATVFAVKRRRWAEGSIGGRREPWR